MTLKNFGAALALITAINLFSCSDKDEPTPAPEGKVEQQTPAEIANSPLVQKVSGSYWVVTDTKVVQADGTKYSISEADKLGQIMDGEFYMSGFLLKDNTLRLFSSPPFAILYADMSVKAVTDNVMSFSDYDVCPQIKFESVDSDKLTITYWHDKVIDHEATAESSNIKYQKGSYFESVLHKATDEEVERFVNAQSVR